MKWLDLNPADIHHILITHQDTDHVGAVEKDSDLLFSQATLYLGKIENRYLTGEKRRKVIYGLYKLPMVITGHTGWHDDLDFVFAHRDQLCHDIKKLKPHDPDAPWDGYDESDDTEQKTRSVRIVKQKWIR